MADKKIVKVLEQMSGTFKVLLAIMFFVSVLLIIGVAMTLKISNASLMMRIGVDYDSRNKFLGTKNNNCSSN